MDKEIILDNDAFLVSQTDLKGNIIYANDDFCNISEYTKEELKEQPHNIIRHKSMPKVIFKEIWETLRNKGTWCGFIKNSTKNGDYYWTYATISPVITIEKSDGYISCRVKAKPNEITEIEIAYNKLLKKELV